MIVYLNVLKLIWLDEWLALWQYAKQTSTCSKSTIEALEKDMWYVESQQ